LLLMTVVVARELPRVILTLLLMTVVVARELPRVILKSNVVSLHSRSQRRTDQKAKSQLK
jgi:hypothetical protein